MEAPIPLNVSIGDNHRRQECEWGYSEIRGCWRRGRVRVPDDVEVGDREGVGELGTRTLQLLFEFPTKAGTPAYPTAQAILLGIQGLT